MSRYVEATGSFGSKEACVSPADNTFGRISRSFQSYPFGAISLSNLSTIQKNSFGDEIDREHTGGISYAQYLLAGYLPVDKTCKGGQVIDGWNVLFIIQDGLVEVGDAPTQRDVVDK